MGEINYGLTEEQLEIRAMLDEFGKERIVPVRAELDEKGIFPSDLLKELAQMDMMGLYIDEAYGGMGVGHLGFCVAVETLSKYCIGVSVSYAATPLAPTRSSSAVPKSRRKNIFPRSPAAKNGPPSV